MSWFASCFCVFIIYFIHGSQQGTKFQRKCSASELCNSWLEKSHHGVLPITEWSYNEFGTKDSFPMVPSDELTRSAAATCLNSHHHDGVGYSEEFFPLVPGLHDCEGSNSDGAAAEVAVESPCDETVVGATSNTIIIIIRSGPFWQIYLKLAPYKIFITFFFVQMEK